MISRDINDCKIPEIKSVDFAWFSLFLTIAVALPVLCLFVLCLFLLCLPVLCLSARPSSSATFRSGCRASAVSTIAWRSKGERSPRTRQCFPLVLALLSLKNLKSPLHHSTWCCAPPKSTFSKLPMQQSLSEVQQCQKWPLPARQSAFFTASLSCCSAWGSRFESNLTLTSNNPFFALTASSEPLLSRTVRTFLAISARLNRSSAK